MRFGRRTAYRPYLYRKVARKEIFRGDVDRLIIGRSTPCSFADLMARGLDIQDCDAVINLELPSDAAHYAHRAGRTGRAGRCTNATSHSCLSLLISRQHHFKLHLSCSGWGVMQARYCSVRGGATRRICDWETGQAAGHKYLNAGNCEWGVPSTKSTIHTRDLNLVFFGESESNL